MTWSPVRARVGYQHRISGRSRSRIAEGWFISRRTADRRALSPRRAFLRRRQVMERRATARRVKATTAMPQKSADSFLWRPSSGRPPALAPRRCRHRHYFLLLLPGHRMPSKRKMFAMLLDFSSRLSRRARIRRKLRACRLRRSSSPGSGHYFLFSTFPDEDGRTTCSALGKTEYASSISSRHEAMTARRRGAPARTYIHGCITAGFLFKELTHRRLCCMRGRSMPHYYRALRAENGQFSRRRRRCSFGMSVECKCRDRDDSRRQAYIYI